MNTKLWDKGFSINQKIELFTIGNDRKLDLQLTRYDLLGSAAHAKMLAHIGLLTTEEFEQLRTELHTLYKKSDDITLADGVEDIHSQIEFILTQKLGSSGKKLHSGRSRNDQVLLDLKLFAREEIRQIEKKTRALFQTLINQSEAYKTVLMPGYTHTQIAMPSSFGLWFGAYAESLVDDLELLVAAYAIVNQNPLGSGAGYGGSFPLDRQMTTDLLQFESLNYNVVYAQMGRGKMEKTVAMALSSIANTIAKFSADVCLYMSQNFGFISLPNELTTGSSIMPHKKNPDVFELLRAKANKIAALPYELQAITANLTTGYHRDLQLLKESFIPAFEQVKTCIEICTFSIQHIKVNPAILDEDRYRYLFSVEAVNQEVLRGVPFREAYKKIGRAIEAGEFNPEKSVHHTHEGSIGNLCNAEIIKKMDAVHHKFNFVELDQLETTLFKDSKYTD